jgi:hypothetical protein
MALRFEFDAENKILLVRFEGRLTDESLTEAYQEIRKYSTASDARAGIVDFSSLTEFAASSSVVRGLARLDPALPDAHHRPRCIVAPATHLFGIARMFQIAGESKRPSLTVVHSISEAFAVLGVRDPHFEPFSL